MMVCYHVLSDCLPVCISALPNCLRWSCGCKHCWTATGRFSETTDGPSLTTSFSPDTWNLCQWLTLMKWWNRFEILLSFLTSLFLGSCLILYISFFPPMQPVDLNNCTVSIFTLNEDGPSMLSLEEEELSAANHWLLPSGNYVLF